MLQLDGSRGEGGGQILRTALALAAITGKGFEILRIRAGREKPGLRNQHLTCVKAAQAITAAEVEGAELNSQQLIFQPQALVGGHYHFEQPGAGSTMLVLQTVLLPLLLAEPASVLTLTGGTHNPMAPPFDFIAQSFLPCLRLMGAGISLQLNQAGFFPAGGGRCLARIEPLQALKSLHIRPEQGVLRHFSEILLSHLPEAVGQREAQALEGTPWQKPELRFMQSRGPGNLILLGSEGVQACSLHVGFGEKRLPAEKVAQKVLERARLHAASKMPVEEHLADQLLLPMALAGEGSFYTSVISEHTRTNIETIQHFLEIAIEVSPSGKGWQVQIGPKS